MRKANFWRQLSLAWKVGGVALLMVCAGCESAVQGPEMIGTFTLKGGPDCGELSLRTDHSFRQTFTAGCKGLPTMVDGQWSLELSGSRVDQISLAPFLVLDEDKRVESANLRYFKVRKYPWTSIQIVVDEDAGGSYEKSDSNPSNNGAKSAGQSRDQ